MAFFVTFYRENTSKNAKYLREQHSKHVRNLKLLSKSRKTAAKSTLTKSSHFSQKTQRKSGKRLLYFGFTGFFTLDKQGLL